MHKRLLYCFIILGVVIQSTLLYAAMLDPTYPAMDLNKKQKTQMLYQLSEIIISGNRKVAVINGNPQKIGDDIFGNKLIAIHKNTVQLQGPGGKITLFLMGKPVKHVSSS